jgi:hypothetical protein
LANLIDVYSRASNAQRSKEEVLIQAGVLFDKLNIVINPGNGTIDLPFD